MTGAFTEIVLWDGAMLETCDEIEAGLVAHDGEIFQSNGCLYWKPAHGPPVKANAALLRVRAMRVARFTRWSFKLSFFVPVDPPLKYFQALLHKGEWRFPTLDHGSAGTIG